MLPILFHTEMVRAILDGRKTVTRRLIKPQPSPDWATVKGMYRDSEGRLCAVFHSDEEVHALYPPYDRRDVLWVRETWSTSDGSYLYRAWPGEGMEPERQDWAMKEMGLKWRPSIHMPRGAARIFLRVTGVRVERLQEITEDGAKAEGAEKSYPYTDPETGKTVFVLDEKGTYRSGFSQIWDRTIKPADLPVYGWAANPWVWVINFERISEEEAEGK